MKAMAYLHSDVGMQPISGSSSLAGQSSYTGPSDLPGNDEDASLDASISSLAARLGIPPPQCSVEQDHARPNLFSGKATFESHASRAPDEPVLVTDVLGEEQARRQIAKKVLQWMQEEEARQRDSLNSLLDV